MNAQVTAAGWRDFMRERNQHAHTHLHYLLALALLAAACAVTLFIHAPAAYAAEGDLAVETSLAASFEANGALSIPATTLTNTTPYPMTITAASAPSELDWTCDAVGKTIQPNSSLQATWSTSTALTSEQASTAAEALPYLVGQLTYSWTYDVPVYASVFENGALVFTQGLPSEETIEANGGYVWESMTGFERSSFESKSDQPWYDYASDIISVYAETEVNPVSTAFWFSDLNAEAIDLSLFNMSEVTNMDSMFESCSSLLSIDTTGWNTSRVTNMSRTFAYCTNLYDIDVSGFNTANVTNFSQIFSTCIRLSKLNLSDWDTSSATTFYGMFEDCTHLATIGDVSGWETGRVTNMGNTFLYCSALKVDCRTWDTSSVVHHFSFSTSTGVKAPSWP